jgi:hypothetical protein
MALYDRVADLPLQIERFELEPLSVGLRETFVRRCTVIHLYGGGEEGVGEDVSYDEAMQVAFQSDGLPPELAGEWTFGSFSAALPELPGFRSWGVESAALDLALRQSGLSLAGAVGRAARPVTFVRPAASSPGGGPSTPTSATSSTSPTPGTRPSSPSSRRPASWTSST